ncbi:MFS transporter [Kineococcus rubinsiae]|uniref:MFS transporter n=1 Tax=Kineococcus rubinsiae TaxID=2609562 RepID=UPI001431833D|nr:MFS transporter [Kineococcus rubinsiae]NIZ91228.1 MFS transporter [Kineococcus rubinsiae]
MSTATAPDVELRRARVAVGACFFVNAVLYANLVPRVPEVKAALDLSNGALGAALAAVPLGSLLAGLTSAALIRRFGSARLASSGLVLLSAALACVAVAPGWWALAAVLLVSGALDAIVDVAQNAHGLRVQRRFGRSILNAFHGVWSLGSVTGGLLGSAAAGLGLPLGWHLGGSAVVFSVVALLAHRWLLRGRDQDDGVGQAEGAGHDDGDGAAAAVVDGGATGGRPARGSRRPAVAALAVLGLLAACGVFVEDAGSSWSTLYLRTDLAAGPAVAGLGYVALSVAMTVGRLTGDRVVDRFGQRRVVRTGGLLAAVGMGAALALPSVPLTLVGFALAGLGVATLVPAVFQAADEVPGLPHGLGLAVSNWLLRLGLLASPLIVGVVSDAVGLRLALLVVVLAGLGAVVFGRTLRGAADRPTAGDPA